ncbi:MAG: histidine kinase [Flavobacteriaceae bacterium]
MNEQLEFADQFYKTNIDSALFYLEKIKPDILSYGDINLIAKTRLYESKFLLFKPNYKEVIEVLKPNIANRKKLDSFLLGKTYHNMAQAYRFLSRPDSAVSNHIIALKIFEKLNARKEIANTYLSLGVIYSKLGNTELKEDFYNKSLLYSSDTEITKKHSEFFATASEKPIEERSIEFSLDIVKMAEAQNDERLMTIAYADIKNEYLKLNNYNKALEYAQKELSLREKTKFNSAVSLTQYFIADIYNTQGKYSMAEKEFKIALQQASDSLKLNIFKKLKEIYVRSNNFKEALVMEGNYATLKDSIYLKNTESSIAEITEKYKNDLNQEQIKVLGVENELKENKIKNQQIGIWAGALVFLLFLVVGFLMYKNYKSKQELQYSQLNFRLLQTQLNPHFMFNALNSIGLQLKDKNATKHITSYSDLMRSILKGSNQDFVSLKEEISFIEKYLTIQQLVHHNAFTFKIFAQEDIDPHYIKIPAMLTQPFVENAIVHGVNTKENGFIEVAYELKEEKVIIFIKDNGSGFETIPDMGRKNLHQSMGTKITEERIKNYKKLHNFNIEMNTISEKNKGLVVEISFPLEYFKR